MPLGIPFSSAFENPQSFGAIAMATSFVRFIHRLSFGFSLKNLVAFGDCECLSGHAATSQNVTPQCQLPSLSSLINVECARQKL
jgi:hypothetical protein